jgi:hypothetical protein
MESTTDVDSLVQRLMTDDNVHVGDCTLIRNPVCDCVLGTDPLGIDTVAAFTANPKGCRDAVIWAMRATLSVRKPCR